MDDKILELLDQVPAMSSEDLQRTLEVLTARRQLLADQLELERTVLRPARPGRLPHWGDTELVEGYQRALAIFDKVIAALNHQISA